MHSTNGENILKFIYKFVFNDKSSKSFEIKIDSETLDIIRDKKDYPDWTKFEQFGCEHCIIKNREGQNCPVAMNLSDIIEFFTDTPSYEEAKIYVISNERQYAKKTSVQVGVSSIIGILMATSGCTHLAKMKPLVRFHLPFASLEDTEFRVLSMYLLAQYFRKKNNQSVDWELKGLMKVYEDIQKVNQNVAAKIADLEKRDTSINAVVVLNNFADFVTFSIDEKDFDHLESLFKPYLD